MHNDGAINMDEECRTFRKPDIILFYNSNKSDIHTVLVELQTVGR